MKHDLQAGVTSTTNVDSLSQESNVMLRPERWRAEAAFFDRLAERSSAAPLNEEVLARYRSIQRPWFDKEFRFGWLGDVSRKRVLDIGCGDGTNALLLAKLGARVTGVDISSKSIQLAQERAEVNRVADSTQFICAPMEKVDFAEGQFDIIWGDGVLHHLIPELDFLCRRLKQWAHPRARMVFSEPVCTSAWVRAVRRHIPIHTDATPDERPLGEPELALVRRHFPKLQLKWFSFLGRLDRFVLPCGDFEGASSSRQAAVSALHRLDAMVLRGAPAPFLGSMGVLYGDAF
jgi:2-polyprenyl-3-methyl-5-hydroxy-6-metoxy-1,4-benzoquinol methylase